jgi:TPR repeat protein
MNLRRCRCVESMIVSALLILFGGCRPEQEAPSPSNSGALSEAEITELMQLSQQGSSDAMYTLSIYYLFHKQDDKQGWSWMEKSAEAGNSDAQEAVLEHLANRGNPEEKARGEKLRQRWRGARAGQE